MRKLYCITSSSRQFENMAKKLATWKDAAESKPVPMNCRLEQKEYFSFMSTVGESSIGEITLINPDNGNDNRVRAQVHRSTGTRLPGCTVTTTSFSVVNRHTLRWILILSQ